jgi:hypothetical protein
MLAGLFNAVDDLLERRSDRTGWLGFLLRGEVFREPL